MFILTDEQYNRGIRVEEYKGVYSLVSARESNDGVIYNQWCKPQTGKNAYASSDVPMAVKLGELDGAIHTLREILGYLENLQGAPDGDEDPDIHF